MSTVGSLAVVLTASATDFERTMGRAARAVQATEKEFMRSARRMEDIGRKWTLGVTAPIMAGFVAIGRAAINWEDDFAGVRKTVDATESQFADLEKRLRKMPGKIPLEHKEIASIAEAAGQLGIQVTNIESFTKTMGMMGTSTNMTSDDAAVALAQMDNIMQSGQKSFDRYGATVVHLGNNLATTENQIVEFGLNIAGAGRIANLHESKVLAIGGAFASVGVGAEAGGTAVSKVLASMTEAVATGNDSLKWFAATSGMTAAEFASQWKTDSGEAFTRFVEGLGRSGDQAFSILRNLGLSDQRLIRGFLSVAGAGDLLRRSMDMGNKAWEENIALIKEANERYKTKASRLKMLRNRIYDAAISLGGAFTPLLESAMSKVEAMIGGLQRLAEWFEALPAPIRTVTGNMLLLLAAIGPAYLAMALLHRTIAGGLGIIAGARVLFMNAAFAMSAWRMGAATLGESLKYLAGGPIRLVIFAISAAIVAAILLAANWDKLRGFAVAAWGAISAAVMYAASLIVRGIGLIISAIGYIIPAVRGAGQALIGLADSLKSSAGQALSSAKAAASTASTMQQAAVTQDNMAKAGQNAADAQADLEDSIKGAGKAAKKGLQGFDEINQLQSSMAGGGAAGMDIGDIPAISIPDMPSVGGGGIGDIAAGIGDTIDKAASTFSSAFERMKQAIEPVNKAVQWIKDNWSTIGPIIEGIASIIMVILLPALIKSGIEAMIAGAKHVAAWVMSGWAAVVNGAKMVGSLLLVIAKWAWAGIMALVHAGKVVLAWAMQGWAAVGAAAKMVASFVLIIARWAWAGAQALIHAARMAAAWVIALGPIAWVVAAVIALAVLIIYNWDWIKEKTIEIWGKVSKWLSGTWDGLKKSVSDKWNAMMKTISDTWNNTKSSTESIWNTIKYALEQKWNAMKNTVSNVFTSIQTTAVNIWNSIQLALINNWNNIHTKAGNTFNLVKNTILNAFTGVKTQIGGIWNNIWTTIKSYINKIISGVNSMIRGMNKLKWTAPNWVPEIGGKSWGISIPTIPMLATGTNNVPKNMLAYLHKGEAVTPKKFNPAVSGASVNLDGLAEKIVAAFKQAQPAMAGAGGDIYVYIGNEQVDAYISRSNDRRNTKSNGR